MLEVSPYVFDRVELGRIGRKPGQDQTAAPRLNEAGEQPASVRGQAVPDDQQPAPHLPHEVTKKLHHLRSADGSAVQAEVERRHVTPAMAASLPQSK